MKKPVIFGGVMALSAVGLITGLLVAQQPGAGGARPAAAPAPAPVTTRIAFINLVQVLKNYQKAQAFQDAMKAQFKLFQDNEARIRSQIEIVKQDMAKVPPTNTPQLELLDKRARELTRQLEDNNTDAKMKMGKQVDDETVLLFKEVQDAAQRFAMGRGYDMVLSFNDAPINTPEYLNPASVTRRMQTAPLMPLYCHPSMDITTDVVNALNAQYRATTPAPAGNQLQPRP